MLTAGVSALALTIRVLGGTAKVAVNYRDMDNQNNTDFNRWTAAVGYDYPLSKRTSLYAMAGYSSEKVKTPTGSATPDMAANSIWASFTASNRMRIPVSV